MHGMSVFDELAGGPAAELPRESPARSPAVVPCDRECDREPDPSVFLVLQVPGEHGGRAAGEPALHEGGAGAGALVRVVRVQAASLRTELSAAGSSEHEQPVSSPRRHNRGISRDYLSCVGADAAVT